MHEVETDFFLAKMVISHLLLRVIWMDEWMKL